MVGVCKIDEYSKMDTKAEAKPKKNNNVVIAETLSKQIQRLGE